MDNNSNIKIIHRSDNEISHSNCLVVAPYTEDPDSRQLLATVEHFSENTDPGGFPWKILPVIPQGVSLKEAMDVAVEYAGNNAVPVILVNAHEFSTNAEKQQTDTKVLQVKA